MSFVISIKNNQTVIIEMPLCGSTVFDIYVWSYKPVVSNQFAIIENNQIALLRCHFDIYLWSYKPVVSTHELNLPCELEDPLCCQSVPANWVQINDTLHLTSLCYVPLDWVQMVMVHCMLHVISIMIYTFKSRCSFGDPLLFHCIWYLCVKLQAICIKLSSSCVDPPCYKSVPAIWVQIVLTHCIWHVCAM